MPRGKVRRGGGEEIPLVQGKEQRLCFAGAAMKRYSTSKVRETKRGDPGSRSSGAQEAGETERRRVEGGRVGGRR